MMEYEIDKVESEFVQIHNKTIEDNRLSWKAKGILIYLISKPNGWKIREKDLYNKACDGYDSTRNGIKELKAAGYMQIISLINEKTSLFMGRKIKVKNIPLFKGGFRKLENLNKMYKKDEELVEYNPVYRKTGKPTSRK